MAKTSKLELIMQLSDKLFNNKLNQVQQKLSNVTDKMEGKLGKFSISQIKLAAGVATAFAAIGGMAIITSTLNRSIDAAEKFDSAFLPIRQLNLDKSKNEIDGYKEVIRNSAYSIGTSIEDSTNAYYDLQSATALYGAEAESVFLKVGKYSIATGAKIGDAINSTTKAMKAFGIGVNGIDALLVSNAKTVQVGITTFDELARVQTEYAGATSAAGQTVDVGNKIFAMFTSISKSSDIAANMTKTFFDGLGQQSANIQKYLGISVFDSDGSMKEADKLLVEISKKFENMSDRKITDIVNKIGGPEGLRGALAKVKTGADDMIATFNAFDSSKFSLEDALKNAEGDYGKMKEMFNNRLEIVFSKIGEKVLPILANIFDKLTPLLNWLMQNVDWLIPAFGSFATVLGIATAAMWLFNIATAANPIGIIILAIAAFIGFLAVVITKWDEFGAALILIMGPIGIVIGAFKSVYDHWESIKKAFQTDGIIGGLKRIGIVLLDVLMKPLQQILELIAHIDPTGLAQKGVDAIKGFRESQNLVTPGEIKTKNPTDKAPVSPLLTSPVVDPTKTKNNKDNKTDGDVNKVAGQANQIRKIDIKIDSFNKGGINVSQSAYEGMSKADVEAWFKEMLQRVIINAETV